jgi:5-hydroxyisourate hydrolase
MAKLSTHILDTAAGRPAENVRIALYRLDGTVREEVAVRQSNTDGRTDQPLLTGETIPTGIYELEFDMGAYFKRRGVALADPPFVDVVVLRFGIGDAHGSYHVPLLASPWSYSTYRGS